MRHGWTIFIGMALVLGLCAGGWAGGPASSVSYQILTAANVRAHVITADLRNPALLVKPAVAYDRPGRGQSFLRFMADHQPLAQISGSYFSVKSWHPVGDLVIDGKLRYRGLVGTALAVRPDNTVELVDIPKGWKYSWPGYEQVLRGGIRLLRQGAYAANPRAQGFRDPGLFRPTSRTAVGITANRRLLLVATAQPITIARTASVMKHLGCTDAMTLDGGTSTGLAYGGSVIITPGRMLSNVLLITERPAPPDPPASEAPAEPATPPSAAE